MRNLYVFLDYLYTSFRARKRQTVCYLVLLILSPKFIWAEGSKEINSNGGDRAYLYSSTAIDIHSFPFPTLGTMKVYVKAGETLHLGSSAQGIGTGTINLRAPDGTTFTSGNSTGIGVIHNINEENIGPKLANTGSTSNGYSPYTVTATAAQEGVWEVDFIAPSSTIGSETIPSPIPAAGNWQQPAGPFIAAFDITVISTANSVIKGRVFTNIFCGQISSFVNGFNGIFYILTKDGYKYTLNNNGQAGNGFSFFVNNKGFETADGKASYKSLNEVGTPLIHDPTSPDTESDITQKIFFNDPAADLPTTAKTPGGSSTWLLNPPFVPMVDQTKFIGFEGTEGKAGTAPLGGVFNFNVTANGTYTLIIDANNNGSFTDPADRKLTGTVISGANSISWDGLDGLGHKITASAAAYNANLAVTLFNAEVHFPFIDVERNVHGIKLTRTTGPGAPENTIYWDDSPITLFGTPSSPVINLTGISSLVNGHTWGSPTVFNDGRGNGDFGNEKSIDTWAYVTLPPVNANLTFTVSEADLEVSNLTSDVITGCVGQIINYTAVVKNNGPSNVTGATFAFNYPAELTGVKVTSTETTGTTTITTESAGSSKYVAVMDMPNGSVRTFTITGKVSKAPTGKLDVSASILRPADITDPDATNPDTVIPTDPISECDSAPSGAGCNNIKTNSITFLAAPDAGPDQTVDRDKIATVTANQAGSWTQVGTTPAAAVIKAPNSAKTDISGLSELGAYQFVFTNINGCTDTVTVNVTSSKLDNSNVITPNGDGKNDHLIIPDINLFPGSNLSIYNRWGNEVYHSNNYTNDWEGKGLADGTYYYLLNRREANGKFKVFKGWIYLKR